MMVAGRPAAARAERALRFKLEPAPIAQSLLEAAQQGGLSLGLDVPCKGESRRLKGRYTPHAAIERLLSDTDCTAVWVDTRTVRIERRPPAMPSAPSSPVETPTAAKVDTLVVTAAKTGVGLFDYPGSVSVVDAARLSAIHSADTNDLALLASGVTVTNLGPGRDKVLLRGLSDGAFTGHTQSTVGIYWEETPLTYNAPDPDLRLVDIQSVEVLRGPQGTLYGAGAIGGILSITPRKPDFDRVSGSLDASGSGTASGAPSADADGVVNLPLLGGRAAARLVAYGEEDGGYIDEPLQRRSDVDTVQRLGLRGAVAVKLSPAWTATLGDTFQDIYSDDTQYTTGGAGSLVRDTRVPEPHDNDFEQVYLDVSGDGGWGVVRAVSSYIHHEFDSRYDASTALPEFGDASGAAGAYDDDTLVRLASQELDFRPPPLGRLTLLLGAYGGYGFVTETARLAPIGGVNLYSEVRTDQMVDLAVFGEAKYALTDRLDLTVGLRAFLADRRTASTVGQGESLSRFEGRIDMSDVAPRAALQYRIRPDAMIYALASEGYRSGGFNTSGPTDQVFSARGGAQPNRTYQPDQLWNLEFGARLDAWDGRLSVQSALYYDVWRQLQADQFLPSGLPYVANVGDARVYGWEQEVSLRPVERLTLKLGALFTAPDLHTVDPSFPSGRSDFTLPGVARRSVNGEVAYDLPLPQGRVLSLSAAAEYVGHSYLFFGPQISMVMGNYIDARAQATLRTRIASVSLFVDNPANSRGDTFAFGNPFTLQAGGQATPQRPRRIGVQVQRGF